MKRARHLHTQDFEVALAVLHGIRVDLAHVETAILRFDVLQPKIPVAVAALRQRDPRVSRYDLRVDRQDRLGVDPNPRHLQTIIINFFLQFG